MTPKMPDRGDFLRPPHGTDKSVVQIKNVVNNVDMSSFRAS